MTPRPGVPPEVGVAVSDVDACSTQHAMMGWIDGLAPYGLFTTDNNLVIRSWNRWLANHSGLSAESVIGHPLVSVFPDVRARRHEQRFVRALHGEISVLSAALHKYLLPLPPPIQEYQIPWMLQTARIGPLPVGDRIVGTITIIEDVTQRECQGTALRRQQVQDRLLSEALASLLNTERPLQIATELFSQIAAPLKLDLFLCHTLSAEGHGHLSGAAGVAAGPKAEAMLAAGRALCARIVSGAEPLLLASQHAANGTSSEAGRAGIRAYAGFPLVIAGRVVATLAFGSTRRDSIEPDEVEFLAKLSQYVAIALERAQRNADLQAAQSRLNDHAADLERKIAERTATLVESIGNLESFSYTIAHDLRQPIRSLVGFSEMLLEDFSASVPPDAQALLHRLLRASRRLDALTRDLLKFSGLAQQQVALTPVDIGELLQDIISVTPGLHGKVLTVHGPLGHVLAQRTLLQQCLANLLDNALKFMPPGREPRFVVRSEIALAPLAAAGTGESEAPFSPSTSRVIAREGAYRRIWVEDNGIGIPEASHRKIFGIFERLPGLVAVEGTGIGLAIVARAVEKMNGTCGIESTVGEGSRFWLELPLAEPAAALST